MIKNLINHIDIFSKEPKMMYNGKNRINSIPGMISSIIVMILICISTVYFSWDIFMKLNPAIFSKQTKNSKYSFFNISEHKDYVLGIENPHLFDNYKNVINFSRAFDFNNTYLTNDYRLVNPYVEIYAIYKYFNQSLNNYINVNLNFQNCSNSIDKNSVYICVNFSRTVLGKGESYNKPENYVQIYLNVCKNRSDTPFNCKTKGEIREWLNKIGNLNIIRPDTLIQMDIIDRPYIIISTRSEISLDYDYLLEREYRYDVNNLTTDLGMIFKDYHESEFLEYNSFEEIFMKRLDSKGDPLFKIKLTTTNNVYLYRRNYEKIQDIFAKIGGILKFILFVFKLATSKFIRKCYYITLSRDLWEESNLDDLKKPDNEKIKSGRNFQMSHKNNISLEKSVSINLNDNFNVHGKDNKFLDYSFKEFIKSIFCSNRIKNIRLKKLEMIYDISKKRINKRLDVVELIKYFIEIDRLKYVLFDESQFESLKILRDKKIEFNIDYIKDELKLEYKFLIENYNKLCSNASSLKKYKSDSKILSMLKRKIINK